MGRLIEQTALAGGDSIGGVIDIGNLSDLETIGRVADVAVDFSAPAALPAAAHYVRTTGTPLLSGVTGLSADDLKALPEGLRQTKRLKAWGAVKLTAGDQQTGQFGDWLYYDGRWYECVSCVTWNHTILGHYRSEFCLVDGSVAKKNLEPPVENAPEEGGDAGDGT